MAMNPSRSGRHPMSYDRELFWLVLWVVDFLSVLFSLMRTAASRLWRGNVPIHWAIFGS